MYVRVKYKLFTAHNLISYAHGFGFPEVNKGTCTTGRNSYSRYRDNAFIFFTFLLIIILITSLVLYADSKSLI